jgi:hypothetical protein
MADPCVQKGHLSVARQRPYQARADFEAALTHFPDHSGAIVGLSNILLDIYTEKLLPPPAVPGLDFSELSLAAADDSILTSSSALSTTRTKDDHNKLPSLPSAPLGLGPSTAAKPTATKPKATEEPNGHTPSPHPVPTSPSPSTQGSNSLLGTPLPPPHRATSLPLHDRLAARDRAHGLLAGLTRLGRGWNDAEAWLALARACEASGQTDKARDALWWCVELEDGRGVRGWDVVGAGGGGGYVL